jgi:hypothetical protein
MCMCMCRDGELREVHGLRAGGVYIVHRVVVHAPEESVDSGGTTRF